MGGEEMYTRNKVVSAREHGFSPIVFHSGIGEHIYIEDLKKYDKYEFSEFRYEPCVISKRKKNLLLKRIKNILKDYDTGSIIESHEILVAEWGEWIAKELGIRHFAYMLLEHNKLSFQSLYDFFKFKYDRHELSGIVKSTIPDMFKGYCDDVIGYSLPAYCTNVYEDIPCKNTFKVGKADFTIGSIGRTNKQYVQPMVDSILKFVSSYKEKRFNILYVGGSMNKQSEDKVINRFSSVPNVNLFFTGMMFPIPIEMIRQMDVCVASAGSCYVSYNCGIPTISMDGNDSKAIGVLGKTTQNAIFRNSSEPQIELDDLLEDVLIKRKYVKEDRTISAQVNFSTHWDFVKGMNPSMNYFDINTIDKKWTLVIQPHKKLWSVDFKEIWQYRDLITLFIKRNIIVQYKQTILGPLWFLIQPVLTVIMNMVVFGGIAKMSTDGIPQPLFYLAGNVCWFYFSDCLNQTSSTFRNNAGMFGKVYFPRLVVPISTVLSNLLRFGIQLLLFIAMYIYFLGIGVPIHPNVTILLIPILVLMMAGLGLGFGILISSMTTKYRDLSVLFGFIVSLWMYATPIVYPMSMVPSEKLKTIILLNPMTSIIEAFKYSFFGEGYFSWGALGYSFVFMCVLLTLGVVIFNRVQRSFMDTV